MNKHRIKMRGLAPLSATSQAILWALLATGLFAGAAAMVKVSVASYHVLQILFFRQIIILLSVLPALINTLPEALRTQHPVLHGARLLGAFVALSFGIWALALLPLTTATVLMFSQSLFVALLAMAFLGERVRGQRLAALLVGFLGVVIVVRPGLDGLSGVHALIAIAGAFGAAVAKVCVRKLTQTDSTQTLLLYQALFIGLLAGLPMFWYWRTPDWADLVFMLGIGAVATLGQWLAIKALRLGEASLLSAIDYMQLIYAAAFAFFIFSETPDGLTVVGAIIIVGSALYSIWHNRTSNKTGVGLGRRSPG